MAFILQCVDMLFWYLFTEAAARSDMLFLGAVCKCSYLLI